MGIAANMQRNTTRPSKITMPAAVASAPPNAPRFHVDSAELVSRRIASLHRTAGTHSVQVPGTCLWWCGSVRAHLSARAGGCWAWCESVRQSLLVHQDLAGHVALVGPASEGTLCPFACGGGRASARAPSFIPRRLETILERPRVMRMSP